jgi:hypothetical protein
VKELTPAEIEIMRQARQAVAHPLGEAHGSAASDTPETENALHGVWYRGDHGSAIPALCRRLERERNRMRSAIEETLRDNAHLADGENCTLIKLKRAMSSNEQADAPRPTRLHPAPGSALGADNKEKR